jgi:hypothetical protein
MFSKSDAMRRCPASNSCARARPRCNAEEIVSLTDSAHDTLCDVSASACGSKLHDFVAAIVEKRYRGPEAFFQF